ncbi:NADH:flavin oxidoreductase/NADH oxidase family protein [Aestuariirhabdus sp. Z084]|uniref:NADH:flavin oxidoreductase/NADH oxidase family protein n=1 Tax=Aestuariirhabdus haliotis TaxID=2918751 RepID=UPI00201B3880|nr:NADH:flavin oxidoreductase/NADH oxidase family protein [Aestuariirhabdus haliotis]MCL6414114.1 NADH:flavin oxidoreductase/NADH oxidase family protein [Aestuariirhabdus haliotis]MCL6418046.1 NADH:flavin oxidoreductase/NADH oxidase family protein [Aestuariirhabdus haliotis]
MSLSLGSPLSLPCGAQINNRIGKSAMTEGLADAEDNPTPEHLRLYQRWSEGGAGLHITGNVMIDRRYLERAGNVVIEDDRALQQLSDWAKAGTVGGNHLWMQISHPGRQCPRLVNNQPLSPSSEQLKLLGSFSRPQAMNEAQIEDAISRFARTAEIAKTAGFTGVQLHCAHGYLISQFLSPLTNKRNDQWGGSLENRARFALRAVRAVRDAVGDSFPVGVKLNSADFQRGGFSHEDSLQVASWLEEAGIDLLEISGGTYEQLSLLGMEPNEVRESTRKREAYFIEYATAMRGATKVPLMVTGGFRQRAVMEQALSNGEVDMVGLARPFCLDPDLPRKLIAGELDALPCHEHDLVLGKGWLGNNSPLELIRGINTFGQVGFYYWQIIRLGGGHHPQPELGVWRSFWRHTLNDFRLNQRRKRAAS